MLINDLKIKCLEASAWLASQNTQLKVVESYYPASREYVKPYYEGKNSIRSHRVGENWIRGSEGYTGDRAYRLFLKLFPNNAIFDKPLTVLDFSRFCSLYFNSYPNDGMSTNRLHYFIQSVRTGAFVPLGNCKKCELPFIAHRDDCLNTVCSVCKRSESVKAEIEAALQMASTTENEDCEEACAQA